MDAQVPGHEPNDGQIMAEDRQENRHAHKSVVHISLFQVPCLRLDAQAPRPHACETAPGLPGLFGISAPDLKLSIHSMHL